MSSLPPTAHEFPPASREQWLELVDKVLKGGPFERLVHTTYDGIGVQPLYVADDVATDADESGFPGSAPHERGAGAAPRPGGQWEVRAPLTHPDPAEANRIALAELDAGSTGLLVRFDEAFRQGVGPAHADFGHLGAVDGVALHGVDGLDRALEGVYLDLAPVTLAPGAAFTPAAAWLKEVWTRRGVGGAEVSGGLGADPLGALAAGGVLPNGLDRSLVELGLLTVATAAATPGVRAVTIDLGPYVEAGATEVQQLAVMAATGAAYLRAIEAAGLAPVDAASQIEITLVLDADVFAGISTVRAARRVWSAMLEACGVPPERSGARISVRTAARMMTRRDPWVNLLRVTAATFAAAVGGADSVTALPFDVECGFPSELGRRMARNTHLLLAEESHVGEVMDPAGGAWYPESLSETYAEHAWTLFGEIEGAGGMAAGLLDGSVAARIAGTWEERRRNFARRKEPITGVSEFPFLAEEAVEAPAPDPAAVRAVVTAGTDVVDHVAPLDPTGIEPLPAHRFAESFEALRDASDAHLARTGERPKVFVASLGPVASHTARTTWTRNLFEAGGIEALVSDGYADADAAVAAFTASGASVVCLCSSDAVYEQMVADVVPKLGAAGATHVYLAGNPGDRRDADVAAGVHTFVHAGLDVVEVLTEAQQILGVTR